MEREREREISKEKKNKTYIILSVPKYIDTFQLLTSGRIFICQTGCKGFSVSLASEVRRLQNLSFKQSPFPQSRSAFLRDQDTYTFNLM